MTSEDYYKYFKEFNPKDFNARKWAALAKKRNEICGAYRQAHDGFCLFDSRHTDFNDKHLRRDIVAEYLKAFRDEGIKVGLYYSLLDWYHPDYPHYSDSVHPMRGNPEYKDAVHNSITISTICIVR